MNEKELYNYLFEYKNGELYRKITTAPNAKVGNKAGSLWSDRKNNKYYYRLYVNKGVKYLHRIIWIMFNGDIESGMEIDHINHNTLDNKIENLRLVSHIENNKNKSKQKNNTSNYSNIFLDKKCTLNPYRVTIRNNKVNYVKTFSTLEEAIQHRDQKYLEFGYHENHGN